MTQEQINGDRHFEYEITFSPDHSILINNNLGITMSQKHNQPHISAIDCANLERKTNHVGSEVFNPLAIEDILITAKLNENNEPEIKIESRNQIQIVSYNYPQDFLKLFEYRKQKEKVESTLSLEDSPQPE